MSEDLENLLESAEPIDDGMTNEVWSAGDRIVKKYSAQAPLALALTAFKIPEGKLEYPSQEQRIQNEFKAERYFSENGISASEIEFRDEEYLVFERVEGVSFSDGIENFSDKEVYEIAKKAGKETAKMHQDGCARRDHRPENLMVHTNDQGFDLHWIDNEYFTDDASDLDKRADIITFLSEARTYPSEKYRWVEHGFQEGYGQEAGLIDSVASSGATIGRLIAVEQDKAKFMNYISSLA